MCKTLDKLKTILSDEDPQDRKTLLFAQLVDDRFEVLRGEQRKTHDAIMDIKNQFGKEKEKYETLTFFISKPKTLLFVFVGATTLIIVEIQNLIKYAATVLQTIIH